MGPPAPLARGLRSSRGRRCSPLPVIPWRRHSSCSGEAQSEEAACCGWAVTSLGWRPAHCVGPRHPATPLGLAGGWRTLATRLAPVACPRPWDGSLPGAGWGTPAPPPPPGLGVPLLVPRVTRSWAFCPLPVPDRRRGGGEWGAAAVPSWSGGRKAEGGAEAPLLSSHPKVAENCCYSDAVLARVMGGGVVLLSLCDVFCPAPNSSCCSTWRVLQSQG